MSKWYPHRKHKEGETSFQNRYQKLLNKGHEYLHLMVLAQALSVLKIFLSNKKYSTNPLAQTMMTLNWYQIQLKKV